MSEIIVAARLVHTEQLEHGRVRQVHELPGYPGMTIVCIGAGDIENWTQHYEVAGQAFTSLPDALNAWRDQFERPMRDRMGEVLRRYAHGLIRPLWRDMREEERESWRRSADLFMAALAVLHIKVIDGRTPQ